MPRRRADDELRESGVLIRVRGQPGEQLHLDLIGPHNKWIAVAIKKFGLWDIIGEHGGLCRRGPALHVAAYDFHFRRALNDTATCFLTATVADMAVLGSLGLAACVASGLEGLKRETLENFQKLTRGRRYSAAEVFSQLAPLVGELVLVDWSVAGLRLADHPRIEAVVAYFRGLYQHLNIHGANARLWQPSQEDLNSINFAVNCGGNTRDIADIIVEKAKRSARPLFAPPPPMQVPLAAMYEKMMRTAFDNRPTSDLPEQQTQFQEEVFKRFTKGQIDQAEGCSDPGEANRLLLAAQLSRELQLRLAERQARQLSFRDSIDPVESRTEMKELLQIAKEIVNLTPKAKPAASPPGHSRRRANRFPWNRK